MRVYLGLALGLLVVSTGLAQKISRKTVNINETDVPITVDGKLDEPIWRKIAPARDFHQTFPYDSSLSDTQCEVYLTYDKDNIYVGTKCNDLDPARKFVILSKRRDFRGPALRA